MPKEVSGKAAKTKKLSDEELEYQMTIKTLLGWLCVEEVRQGKMTIQEAAMERLSLPF